MSAKRTGIPSLAPITVRQSPRVTRKLAIDESKTAVTTGLTTSKSVNGSGGLEDDASPNPHDSSDETDEQESEDETPANSRSSKAPKSHGKQAADVDTHMADVKADDAQDGSDDEPTSPTFGDLMRGSSTVDVSSALAPQPSTSLTRANPQRALATPVTSTSLGTVLNQALRTDDSELLESCLQISDFKIIQNTINRMDSALAAALLSKLADRMHRRPGRAFGLMRWMQWTLVAHGGTLVTQPNLVAQLEKLNRVLEERARALPTLLALRGKLDMLDAQMKYRKAVKKANKHESEDPDEPGVVYVEGQEEAVVNGAGGGSAAANGASARGDQDVDFGMNGFQEDSDDSEEEDVDDLAEELADVESMDEDEVVHDDVEDESGDDMDDQDHDDDDDELRAPPAKMQKTAARGIAGRK